MIKSHIFHTNRVKSLKMKCLLSHLGIHILKITLRENSKPSFPHIINFLNNQQNNLYSSIENNARNQTSSHQNTLNMNFLPSLMKLRLLNISLRQNSRPSLINLTKFLNKQKNNLWMSQNNSIKNQNRLKNNCLLSTQKHRASQKLLK